jgi:hypothetical protein
MRKLGGSEAELAFATGYFSGLGVGFMAFELSPIQIMTLLLGHPTYALSVVLFGLLIFAGLGSYLMGRLPLERIQPVLIAIVLLGIGSGLGLLGLVHHAIHLSFGSRLAITLLYLALIGIPLGMPFVAGIRVLDAERPHQVAWAWACNGASAVVGSCVLMIVMVYLGSYEVLLTGAACYSGALLLLQRVVAPGESREAQVSASEETARSYG